MHYTALPCSSFLRLQIIRNHGGLMLNFCAHRYRRASHFFAKHDADVVLTPNVAIVQSQSWGKMGHVMTV